MAVEIIKTIKPSGGDYTSLSAWEAGEQGDLINADEIAAAECYSMHDSDAVLIDGWVTDATRYIKIYTPDSERHGGIWNTGKYYLETAVSGDAVLRANEKHIRIAGLQVRNTQSSPSGLSAAFISNAVLSADVRVSHSIFRDGRYTVGILATESCFFWNNVVYGGTWGGAAVLNTTPYLFIYSCTIIGGSDSGIYRINGTVEAKNCYCKSNGVDYQGTITKTTCASSDATGSAGLQNIPYSADNFVNVTPGSEDFHLSESSALVDVGTDTSGDPSPLDFSDDIDGNVRSGTWDVGADELLVASPSVSPSLSPSESPSNSPSVSPSESPSASPSFSVSPSASPSTSPSASPSPEIIIDLFRAQVKNTTDYGQIKNTTDYGQIKLIG